MKVIWHPRAEMAKLQVADYIREQFGFKRKKAFMKEVRQVTQKLRRSPYIGQIDQLFEGRAKTYRSIIINGLNKMVYYIEDDTVHIAAFWDTRMEPEEQTARVK